MVQEYFEVSQSEPVARKMSLCGPLAVHLGRRLDEGVASEDLAVSLGVVAGGLSQLRQWTSARKLYELSAKICEADEELHRHLGTTHHQVGGCGETSESGPRR